MGITTINNGSFYGLRVTRRIAGKSVSKNFSLKMPVRKKSGTTYRNATADEVARITTYAEEHDRELAQRQINEKVEKEFDPLQVTIKNNTGVRGITYRKKREHGYDVHAFFLCLYDDNKKVYSRYHRTTSLGWKGAWHAAVDELCELKNIKSKMRSKLRAMIPPESIADDAVAATTKPVKKLPKRKVSSK
jgi:hypothetical protein